MATLAPTVHERLARCGTRVYVDGLVAGADVGLSVDGIETSFAASNGAHNFLVPSLTAGVEVKARQDAGEGFSPLRPVISPPAVRVGEQTVRQLTFASDGRSLRGVVPRRPASLHTVVDYGFARAEFRGETA